MFSYVSLEQRVPQDHPLRAVRKLTDAVLRTLSQESGYTISLSRRWLVEKGFGWLKQTGPLRQVKLRGLEKVDWLFVFSCAAYNLIRLPRLIEQRTWVGLREQCA